MVSDFYDQVGYRYKNIDNYDLNQSIGREQRELLREFFGASRQGAEYRTRNFQVPEGLSRETLETYGEIARRLIEENNDPLGVQAIRFRLVIKALELFAS